MVTRRVRLRPSLRRRAAAPESSHRKRTLRLSRGLLCALWFASALLCGSVARASELDDAYVYPVGEKNPEPAPAPPTAEAEREPNFSDHPFTLQVRSGFATSVGFIGALAELNVHDRLAINAGLGTNFYGASPAVGVRLRPLVFSSGVGTTRPIEYAVTIEGSASRAAFGEQPSLGLLPCIEQCTEPSSKLVTRVVSWGQLELGGELRAAGHYQLLGSFGWAKMLGNPRFDCVQTSTGERFDCSGDSSVTRQVFVMTWAFGYAF